MQGNILGQVTGRKAGELDDHQKRKVDKKPKNSESFGHWKLAGSLLTHILEWNPCLFISVTVTLRRIRCNYITKSEMVLHSLGGCKATTGVL